MKSLLDLGINTYFADEANFPYYWEITGLAERACRFIYRENPNFYAKASKEDIFARHIQEFESPRLERQISVSFTSSDPNALLAAICEFQRCQGNPFCFVEIAENGLLIDTWEFILAGLDLETAKLKLVHTGYRPTITSMH